MGKVEPIPDCSLYPKYCSGCKVKTCPHKK